MAKRIKAEVFFLKVSKLIIMVIMGLALLLAIIGLIYGLFQWNQSPQSPSPAQRADPPTVAKEDFLKEYFAPSHADRAEDAPKESPSPSRSSLEPTQENPYDPIFAQLNTCVRNVNVITSQNGIGCTMPTSAMTAKNKNGFYEKHMQS